MELEEKQTFTIIIRKSVASIKNTEPFWRTTLLPIKSTRTIRENFKKRRARIISSPNYLNRFFLTHFDHFLHFIPTLFVWLTLIKLFFSLDFNLSSFKKRIFYNFRFKRVKFSEYPFQAATISHNFLIYRISSINNKYQSVCFHSMT